MRKLALVAGAVLACASSFGAVSTSLASEEEPRVRANLDAGGLPITTLGEPEQLAISNLIGRAAAHYGVSSRSYAQARRLSDTSAGPLYLIPGSRGACLTIARTVTCGDPGSSRETILAVLVRGDDGHAVGGGVVASPNRRVVVRTADGRSRAFPIRRGVFAVSAADAVDLNVTAFDAER